MKPILLTFILVMLRLVSTAQVNSFDLDSTKFNKPLMLTLDTIYKDDQDGRFRLVALTRSKASTTTIDSLRKALREQDIRNLAKVNAIIAKYGWLGPQKVGFNGSQALFLVIQHADLATQEKYLPMIRKAEKDGETLSSNLAIMEDRVAMRHGEKQIYGSQGFTDKATGKKYIYPIIDPDHLDDRRKAMGMGSMSDYMKLSNATWDLEAYKKDLPEIERIAKAQQ